MVLNMTIDSWVTPLSTAVASGLIGVLGVLAGSWLTARHDDRRWKRELAHEQDLWRRDDDRRWVDARKVAYASYLAAIDPWIRRVRHWKEPHLDPEITADTLREKEAAFDVHATMEKIKDPEAEMRIIGNEKASEAGRSLVAQLIAFEATHITRGTRKQLAGMAEECEKRLDKLRAAMREDLGIPSDSAPLNED